MPEVPKEVSNLAELFFSKFDGCEAIGVMRSQPESEIRLGLRTLDLVNECDFLCARWIGIAASSQPVCKTGNSSGVVRELCREMGQ